MATVRRSEYEFSGQETFQDGETIWDFAERLKNRVAPDGSIEGIHVEASFVDVGEIGDPQPRSVPSHARWILQVTEPVEVENMRALARSEHNRVHGFDED